MKKLKKIDVNQEKPLLVFGGAYSNFEAVDSLYNIAKNEGIPSSNVISTGDIIGYCADPEKTLQLVKNWEIHSIAGNVEIQLRNGEEGCGCDFNAESRCDFFAKQWYPFAQRKVSDDSIEYMHKLPEFLSFNYAGQQFSVVHGSYFHTSEFLFKSTPWVEKSRNFEAMNADIILAGHCGLPFHDKQGEKYWLNPGVIGMPANDGTTRVWYLLIKPTDDGLDMEHRFFEFDYDETFARMLEEELPLAYAKTLSSGLWDNNDILPPTETAAQGIPLSFSTIKHPKLVTPIT